MQYIWCLFARPKLPLSNKYGILIVIFIEHTCQTLYHENMPILIGGSIICGKFKLHTFPPPTRHCTAIFQGENGQANARTFSDRKIILIKFLQTISVTVSSAEVCDQMKWVYQFFCDIISRISKKDRMEFYKLPCRINIKYKLLITVLTLSSTAVQCHWHCHQLESNAKGFTDIDIDIRSTILYPYTLMQIWLAHLVFTLLKMHRWMVRLQTW
jgi:hypothetical protein